jgi:predicted nucleic acid-binding protein
MKVVVDTSAVISVNAGEAVKPRSIELTKDAIIVAPPSIDWEIGNAFSAMLKRGRLELEQAIEAIQVYQEIAIEIVEIDLKEAVRLAGKHKIYAYDAYIIQCAKEYDLPLISLDGSLIEIAKREGISVIEVEP